MSFWRAIAKVLGFGGSCLGGCHECCGDDRPHLGFAVRFGGKILWVFLHVVVLSVVFTTDTDLGRDLKKFDASSLLREIPFFVLLVINLVLFLWLCTSNPGYILSESPLLNGIRSLDSQFFDDPDIESMGLLQRTAGFSDRSLLDDNQRQALFADRKLNDSPNNSSGRDSDDAWQLGSGTGIELQRNPSGRGNRRAQVRLENPGQEWYQGPNPGRTCRACGAWQTLRARHCYDCNRCVEKFDHHCNWIGKCIGRGNHHIFWGFLVAQTTLVVWVLISTVVGIAMLDSHQGSSSGGWGYPLMMAVMVPLVFLLIFVGGLLFFHTYLISTNQTTFEVAARWKVDYLKDLPGNTNPFGRGLASNLWDGFCLRVGHEYVLPSRDVALPVYQGTCPQGCTCCERLNCC
ncbi:hypothetical protein BSKO_11360 [Bryopsis sp. KO-2023]|nr:hypothetical protein BSKO_11360 [Bryopsis sp. KO-2023]